MKSMEIKKQVNRLEKYRHSDSLWIRAGKVGREYLKQKNAWEEVGVYTGIAGLSALIAWLFFDSVFGLVVIIVCMPLIGGVYRKRAALRRDRMLEAQFQDGLGFAAAALETGYSVENAWKEAQREVETLHREDAVFAEALRKINQKAGMNEPLERQFLEFAGESGLESIQNFAEVFYFARKSGGNLTSIMRLTADRLRQNFRVQEEIALAISSRQFEQRIMSVMPLGILAYLRVGSPGFLAPLYHNVAGVVIMTGCLALYGIAWYLSVKLTEIEI